jgi:hypothetical protein
VRVIAAALSLVPAVVLASAGADSEQTLRPRTSARSAANPAATTVAAATKRGAIAQNVYDLAFAAAECAVRAGAVEDPATLTVIDYSRPSTEKRLWVYDASTRELLYEELVAHGQGTGENYARRFSNEPNTHASSLGLFVTEGTYIGRNGYSLRLDGLDRGFNHRARERAIVVHGAPYVDAEFARVNGRLGRSWGCPALRESVARQLIDTIKGGSLLFAYYPDPEWLASSAYLGTCAAASN